MTHENLEKAKMLEEEIKNLKNSVSNIEEILDMEEYKGYKSHGAYPKILKYFLRKIPGIKEVRIGVFHECGGTDIGYDLSFDRDALIVLLEHYRDRLADKEKSFFDFKL